MSKKLKIAQVLLEKSFIGSAHITSSSTLSKQEDDIVELQEYILITQTTKRAFWFYKTEVEKYTLMICRAL